MPAKRDAGHLSFGSLASVGRDLGGLDMCYVMKWYFLLVFGHEPYYETSCGCRMLWHSSVMIRHIMPCCSMVHHVTLCDFMYCVKCSVLMLWCSMLVLRVPAAASAGCSSCSPGLISSLFLLEMFLTMLFMVSTLFL